MHNLPCLLLCYSRFEGFKRVFESCISNGVIDFYIAIDGPSNNDVQLIQNQICEYIEARAAEEKFEVRILKRKKNWGAAISIITAVDWFFEQVDFGCVFEDDLEIGNDFFKFAMDNLDLFRDDKNVWMISGNQFIDLKSKRIQSNSWTNYPLVWGWASWSDRWGLMSKAIRYEKFYPNLLSHNRRINFLQVGATRAYLRRIDAWDLPLAFEMMRLGKFTLLPNTNLVSNVGNDKYALHTKKDAFPLNVSIGALESFEPDTTNRDRVVIVMNKLIENLVFIVKKRHAFLPLWIYFKGESTKTKSDTIEIGISSYFELEK